MKIMKKYILLLSFIINCLYLYGQTWTPGTVTLPQPDSAGYLLAPQEHYAVWRENRLLRQGMKIRFDNIRISSQSGNTIYISGSGYPSVELQDIVPNDFLNVPLNMFVIVSAVSTYSATLQLERIEIIGSNRIWRPN